MMKFVDVWHDDGISTLQDMKKIYDEINLNQYYSCFAEYIYFVILDTLAKRNDVRILNYNATETDKLLKRLKMKLKNAGKTWTEGD